MIRARDQEPVGITGRVCDRWQGRNGPGGDAEKREIVSQSVRRSTGLLSVLVLIVLGVIRGGIVLTLRIIALTTIALLTVLLTVASATIATLRGAVAVVGLWRGYVALPDFRSPPGRDVGSTSGNIVPR